MAADVTFREFARLRKPLLKSQFPFLKDCQIQARLKKQWNIRKNECIITRQLSELDSQGVDGMTDAVKIKQTKTKYSSLEASVGSPPAESHETSLDSSHVLSSSQYMGNSFSSSVKKLPTTKSGKRRKKVKNSKAAGGKATKTKLGVNSKLDSGVGNMVSGYLHHSCDNSESSPPPLSIDINACQTVKPYPLPAISQSGISQCETDMSPSSQDSVDSVSTHDPDHSLVPSSFRSSPTISCHVADDEIALNKPTSAIIQRKSKSCTRRPQKDKQHTLCAKPHQEGPARFTNVQHEEEAVEKIEGEGKERCGGKNMTCNKWQEEGDDGDAFFISKCRKNQQHTAKVDTTGGAMCALFLPLHSTSPHQKDNHTNQIESVPDTDNDDSLPLNDEDSIFL